MPVINFVGGSYQYDSLTFDAQRSVNLYPVGSESGTSRAKFALHPTPGKNLFANLSNYQIRGAWEVSDRGFFVAGNELFEIFSNGTSISRGTISTYSGRVSISDNGAQLCVVDGTQTGGYILDLTTNIFTQITDPYFLGAVTVVFLGGYFIFNKPNSSVYYISTIYDGLTGDPTEFAVAEGSPDNLTALAVLHNQLYLIGNHTTEIAYNSGEIQFPITPLSGTFIEYGSIAPFSIVTTANAIFWVKRDTDGGNMVFKAESYSPVRISNNAIESFLNNYDLTNSTAYTYQESGKTFYCLNSPGMPTTLCYDVDANLWHERCDFNPAVASFSRDRADCHIYCFGKHLVGDFENGNIYEQSLSYTNNNGTPIRRQRILPYIIDDLEYIYYKDFQIDMQVATGLVTGDVQDTDPEMFLEWSNDGVNFTNGRVGSIGKVGTNYTRVRWTSLGRDRTRVYRLTTSTNAKIFLIAAHSNFFRGN